MPGTHAKLAPSASKRWMTCTASPPYIAELVEQGIIQEGGKDSIYSLEGLEAHDWGAKVLKGELSINKVPEPFRPHIAEYVEVCHECCHEAHPDSIRIVEQKVPLFYAPEETGTVDFAIVRVDSKGRVEAIHIRDLKYGQGVPVDAEENTQLAIYAQSLIEDLATWWGTVEAHTPVSIGIHQPRYHGDDSLKVWELSAGELQDFCNNIGNVAAHIGGSTIDELQFAPSYAVCQFCPAKAVCKARLESAFQDFPADVNSLDDFTNLDMPSVESVDPATLVTIWSKRKEILGWLESVEEHLTALAHSGNRVEGTKLVLGRDGNRQWRDPLDAEKFLCRKLADHAYKPKEIISPAVAEKMLKSMMDKTMLEDIMTKWTCRSEGKPVLALESDKRPAVETAAAEFDVITDEEDV